MVIEGGMPKFRPELDFESLQSAYRRLLAARLIDNPDESYAPAAECLHWIAVLDNWFGAHHSAGLPDYISQRNSDPIGKVVAGHRYVNNLMKHISQLEQILDINRGGVIFPVMLPTPFFELVWKPFPQLPQVGQRSQFTEFEEQSYQSYLQGQPSRNTVSKAVEYYSSLI